MLHTAIFTFFACSSPAWLLTFVAFFTPGYWPSMAVSYCFCYPFTRFPLPAAILCQFVPFCRRPSPYRGRMGKHARSKHPTSTSEDKVYNKRPEINAAYYELRDQINGYYTVKKKAAPWSTVTAALNGVIKDYNNLRASRGTQVDATPVIKLVTPIV